MTDFRGEVQQAMVLPNAEADRDGFGVVAIDIYEDGVGVRWAAPAPSQPTTRDELEAATEDFHDAAFPDLELTDDLGNRYGFLGGVAGSTDEVMRGESIFDPLSPSAARLTVHAGGREWEFDLSQALRRA